MSRRPPGADIRIGIGGWSFADWRGVFYPRGLPHARELEHAGRAVTAIEINATYHRLQRPGSFASWAAQVPEDFVFTVKASRFCTNRKNLREAGEGMERFFAQGLTELGDKLGPILWQLMETKRFDAGEIRDFLAMLPRSRDGHPLRHALEVRHPSFRDPAFVDMARKARVAIVVADSDVHPQIADLTADFVYARLQRSKPRVRTGYVEPELARWADVLKGWAAGAQPDGLTYVGGKAATRARRDVFAFVVGGAKVRAPAAASALIARIAGEPRSGRDEGSGDAGPLRRPRGGEKSR